MKKILSLGNKSGLSENEKLLLVYTLGVLSPILVFAITLEWFQLF